MFLFVYSVSVVFFVFTDSCVFHLCHEIFDYFTRVPSFHVVGFVWSIASEFVIRTPSAKLCTLCMYFLYSFFMRLARSYFNKLNVFYIASSFMPLVHG